MRHLVLTRSAYGPEWSDVANLRRLAVTRDISAKMMGLQTTRDWTWVVLLDERDPHREERLAAFQTGGEVVPILWRPGKLSSAPWDHRPERAHKLERVAATAYAADWRQGLEGDLLMTRLDDDDALAVDTLRRVRARAEGTLTRTAFMHPMGYRVYRARYSLVRHDSNAMQSLFTPSGDAACVYDYGHTVVRRYCPVVTVDEDPAWLWVRHRDTISGWKQVDRPITSNLRRMFPIDWSLIR